MNFIFKYNMLYMLQPRLNLRRMITGDLLYYSWVDIKFRQKYLFRYFSSKSSEPLSKSWFYKTAFLLRRGVYNFQKVYLNYKQVFNSKRNILGVLKTKILENAFLLILKFVFYKKKTFLQNINLTECLRLCLNNKLIEFVIMYF